MRRCLAAGLGIAWALAMPIAWAASPLALERVADGLYVHWGAQAHSAPANQGAIANSIVVLGQRCVAVIDPGGSLAFGLRLRQTVAALSDKPVCAVINTHLHPDHLLGNSAFVAPGTAFYSHALLPAGLAQRAASYLASAQRELGESVAGTAIHTPTELVSDVHWLDLGGRRLRLQAHGLAHTRSDLSVWDEASDTLCTGDLLFVGHVPVVDGSVRGWLGLLEEMSRQRYARVVPGHGPLVRDWPQGAQSQIAYLSRLLRETRLAVQQGLSLSQAMQSVAQANAEGWLLFDLFHRRNVAAVYTELEWE